MNEKVTVKIEKVHGTPMFKILIDGRETVRQFLDHQDSAIIKEWLDKVEIIQEDPLDEKTKTM